MRQSISKLETEQLFFGGKQADQTLYGMAAVSHLLSGEENGGKTSRDLFGWTSEAPNSPMAGRPYEFFQRGGHAHWPDLETLLNEHLLFPLYRAVAAPERYEAGFAKAMQPGRSGSDVLKLGLHSVKRGTRDGGLRLCPFCVREDSKTGPALWRLSHQIPWVTHCWRHGTPLIARCTACGTQLAPARKPRMPRAICPLCGESLSVDDSPNDFEAHVACFYLEIQITRGAHIAPEARMAACRTRAAELGYKSEGDAVRAFISEVFTSAMREHDGKLFGRLSDPRDWEFSFRTLFRSDRQLITRHEALFLPWLFNKWSDILAYSVRPSTPDKRVERRALAEKRPGLESPEQREARMLAAMDRGLTPFAAARECRLPVLCGKYLAHRIGHPLVARRASYSGVDKAMIAKVIESAKSGMYTYEIAAAMNMSEVEVSVIRSVYYREIGDADRLSRQTVRIQEAKDRLRKRVSAGRWLTASQLRQEAASDYSFLLEHDPEWLTELLTTSGLYSRRQRLARLTATDDELLALLRELDARWGIDPPPYRKSVRRIRHELADSAWTLDDLHRLPKSKAFVKSIVETGPVANLRLVKASLLVLRGGATVDEISQHTGVDGHCVRIALKSVASSG